MMMSKLWLSLLLLSVIAPQFVVLEKVRQIETIFQWRQLVFGFPSDAERQQALASGNLVPANAVPIDVAPHYMPRHGSRVFVTVPKFQTGIPYSLATVTEQKEAHGPILQPYPNYKWQNIDGRNCDGITSAFRVVITECNHMWVIDAGTVGGVQTCPPQLLVFDLTNDELVHRYRFNTTVYVPVASLLITPVVVVHDPPPQGRCRRVMVYLADVTHHAIIVYDSSSDTAWRAENKYMYPDPDYGTHTIAGETFILMDGIFGMASDKQLLYFHPLASISEYAVPLEVLNNRTLWQSNPEALPAAFRPLGTRPSECTAEAIDSHKNIYCVTLNPIKLLSWNVNSPYTSRHMRDVAIDASLLEFVSGMKVQRNDAGKEELWMLSNRFQKVATGTLTDSEINFRVLRRAIDDLQHTSGKQQDLNNRLIFN